MWRCLPAPPSGLQTLSRAFDTAAAYLKARAADPRTPHDLRRDAMAPALRGERPVFVVAHGLPADEALKAITLYPAQILGVADELGALASGRLASFIVTDGNPLETATQVRRVFIQGREVDAGNRQQRLERKYQQRAADLGAAPGR